MARRITGDDPAAGDRGRIVAVVNMKGGTGKTTIAVGLADALAHDHNRRVTVVDCDPQVSASLALIGELAWFRKREAKETIDRAIMAAMRSADPERGAQKFHEFLVTSRVSNLKFPGRGHLSLMASSTELPFVERKALKTYTGRGGHSFDDAQRAFLDLLEACYRSLAADADYVVIDCPPGVSYFTEAAIAASDYFLVPTIPDEISGYGLEQLDRGAYRLRKRSIFGDLVGVVISKYQPRLPSHAANARRLREDARFYTFDATFQQQDSLATLGLGADKREIISFDEKYNRAAPAMRRLGREFEARVRALEGDATAEAA